MVIGESIYKRGKLITVPWDPERCNNRRMYKGISRVPALEVAAWRTVTTGKPQYVFINRKDNYGGYMVDTKIPKDYDGIAFDCVTYDKELNTIKAQEYWFSDPTHDW